MEYGHNYSKTSGSLCVSYRDERALDEDANIIDFVDNDTTDSFKFKEKIIGKTGYDITKNIEIMIPLNYLSNFRKTLEMTQIDCEIRLSLI